MTSTSLSESQVKVLVARLTRTEGRTNKPYVDTVGKITIGVGFNLTDVGLFDDEIDYIFNRRIEKANDAASSIRGYLNLDPVRQTVIVDMVYNIGLDKVLEFKNMWAAIALNKFDNAADEMLNSRWAVQVGNRAVALAKIMKDGVI